MSTVQPTPEAFLATLNLDGRAFFIERATAGDVAAIVALLRDDVLGQGREQADIQPYEAAFAAIDRDPQHTLVVVRDESRGGEVIGTLQLTLIPGLSRGGATRLQIEGVRIAASARGTGLGSALLQWAADFGRAHGAALAQLTTDKQRPEAKQFYERLGYHASHEGMKLDLSGPTS